MAENRKKELLIEDEFCPSYSLEETHLGDMQEDVEIKNTPIKGKVCIQECFTFIPRVQNLLN